MKLLKNHPMKEHSNMKVGGIAQNYFIAEEKEDVKNVLDNYKNVFILGNGTNTLIPDGNLKTNFLSIKNFNKITELGDDLVEVEAGVDFSDLIEFMEEKNYSGIESMAGIPGTVGGLVYMNGGAHGTEIFDFIDSIEIIDENHEIRKVKKEKIDISYRSTEIQKKHWVVLSATFKFNRGFNRERVLEVRFKRETNHPLELPNLGSSFKNPEGQFAVKLIIAAGMKGHRVGNAQMSEKHANFIVNLGDATFADIRQLIAEVKAKVKEVTGVELEEEIVTINE